MELKWVLKVILYTLLLLEHINLTFIRKCEGKEIVIQEKLSFRPYGILLQGDDDSIKLELVGSKVLASFGSRRLSDVKIRVKLDETRNYYTQSYADRIYDILGIPITLQHHTVINNKLIPDYTDPKTVKVFAMMSYMSYQRNAETFDDDWDYLWRFEDKGSYGGKLGGIVYLSNDAKNIGKIAIIAFKGTSTILTDSPNFDRYKNDKTQDNLMFSCCCAKPLTRISGSTCPCYLGENRCDLECLLDRRFYMKDYLVTAASYYNLVRLYIKNLSQIWTTGHSLGGALASLTSIIYNTSAITFASPGELLFAYRIGLIPNIAYDNEDREKCGDRVGPYKCNKKIAEIVSKLPVYNFGNDRDPIFNATCKGIFSLCYWTNYVLESRCHIGSECIYTHNTLPKLESIKVDAINTLSLTPEVTGVYPENNLKIVKNSTLGELIAPVNPLGDLYTSIEPQTDFLYYHRIAYYLKNFIIPADKVPTCSPYISCPESECSDWKFV